MTQWEVVESVRVESSRIQIVSSHFSLHPLDNNSLSLSLSRRLHPVCQFYCGFNSRAVNHLAGVDETLKGVGKPLPCRRFGIAAAHALCESKRSPGKKSSSSKVTSIWHRVFNPRPTLAPKRTSHTMYKFTNGSACAGVPL